MLKRRTDRRTFLRGSVAAGMAGLTAPGLTALSYGRVLGANDRIAVGLIGCGHRGRYLVEHGIKASGDNAAVTAACDIHKSRLEEYAGVAGKMFGARPSLYADHRRLLAEADVDAVIIATPDHQHCGMGIDAVQAGRHAYIEKPLPGLACDLPDLNRLYDAVKASRVAVQVGTQGVSSPGAAAIRKVIEEKRLGRLFRVESTETLRAPYWVGYTGPETEADTDWKAFLYNRPERPFDPVMHAKWMGYIELTSGTIGGWMSHFVTLVHFVTGCKAPVSAVAWGGRYAPTADPRCTAPDQTAVLLDYEEGFHTQFTSHFGSDIDNEKTVFMFEKGCIRCRFGHSPGNPVLSTEGVADDPGAEPLLESEPPHPLTAHVKNWLDCARSGAQPAANMELSHKHGIAVVLGDLAWTLNRKVYYDPAGRAVHA